MSKPYAYDPKQLLTFLASTDAKVSCTSLARRKEYMDNFTSWSSVLYIVAWVLLVAGMGVASAVLPSNTPLLQQALGGTKIGKVMTQRNVILGLGWTAVIVFFIVLVLTVIGVWGPLPKKDIAA